MSRNRSLTLVAVSLVLTCTIPAAPTFAAAQGHSGAGLAAAPLPPLAPGDWTERRDNANGTGVNTAETGIGVANVGSLHLRTTLSSVVSAQGAQAGATGHGLLFYGLPSGGIRAQDQSSGALRWTSTVGSELLAVGAKAVYTVASRSGGAGRGVFALDAGTGRQLWHKTLKGVDSTNPPTLAGNQLIVTWEGHLGRNSPELAMATSYNATTGAEQWQTTLPTGLFPSQPTVGGTVVAVESETGNIQTLNLKTGALRWRTFVGGASFGYDQSRPVIQGNVLYAGLSSASVGYAVAAYNTSTGHPLWTVTVPFTPDADPAVDGGVVYIAGEGDGTGVDDVFALDAATGSTIWSARSGADGPVTVANGVVYVPTFFGGTDLKAYAAATGALLATVPMASQPSSEAMVSHGAVYILEESGSLDVLSP